MKKLLPDLLVIFMFAVLSFAYFFPADIENRILFQHDTAAGAGAGQEATQYREETGEYTRWTNSLFGGMPTYQIAPSYESTQPLTWVQKVYQLFFAYVCQPDIYPDAGLFHLVACIRYTYMVGRIRWINVGILILLLHSDICRTHLEVYHAGLYTTYNSRYRTGLPG